MPSRETATYRRVCALLDARQHWTFLCFSAEPSTLEQVRLLAECYYVGASPADIQIFLFARRLPLAGMPALCFLSKARLPEKELLRLCQSAFTLSGTGEDCRIALTAETLKERDILCFAQSRQAVAQAMAWVMATFEPL